MYGMILLKYVISFGLVVNHVKIKLVILLKDVIMIKHGQEDIALLSAKLKMKELNNFTMILKLEEFTMEKYQTIT